MASNDWEGLTRKGALAVVSAVNYPTEILASTRTKIEPPLLQEDCSSVQIRSPAIYVLITMAFKCQIQLWDVQLTRKVAVMRFQLFFRNGAMSE